MNKIEKIVYGAFGITLIGLIILLSSCGKTAEAGKIGDLAEKINSLQDKKQECYDNLSYKESLELSQGKVKYCFQYDDDIIKAREQLDKLTYHEYVGLK